MSRRSGLGRGLGALIPQAAPTTSSDSKLRDLPLDSIRPNKFQPRTQFHEETLSALVDSIKAVGLLQPVLVRETSGGEFELIAGERRYRAARRAGLATIPALVQGADDATSLEHALVENLHREDLNPLDEAGAYQQLIEDFSLTHDEVARRVGRSRASITNALRLFQLPPSVQRHVRDGRLSAGHARALLGTPDRSAQEHLAEQVIANGWSVRTVEDQVRTLVRESEADLALEEAGLHRAPLAVVDGERAGEVTGEPGGVAAGADATETPTAMTTATATEDTSTPNPTATMGSDEQPLSRLRPPGVLDLEELLGDYLNTRVHVDMTAKRGRVVIEFANLDDLERIYRIVIGEYPAR